MRRLVFAGYQCNLPTVLSVEEVGRLLEAAPGPNYSAALGTAYGAELRASEGRRPEDRRHRLRPDAEASRQGQPETI